MELRRFRKGDEAALFHVYFSAIHEIASRDYTHEQTEAWAPADMDQNRWASHIRSIRPFVVEVAGEIAGYADVQANGYIDHFYVSAAFAKQGVGTRLMLAIHEEARSLGLSELTSNVSKTAEAFFKRHGFYVVRRGYPVRRGVILQNALMRKERVNTVDRSDDTQET